MASRSSLAIFFCLAALASLAAACSGGGDGDPPSEPAASVLGSGLRVSEVLEAADWLDPEDSMSASCSFPADETVGVTGVTVVAIDRFDEISDGASGNMYVQDTSKEPVEYSGMTVFSPSFTPPDLRVARGDVLDIFGVYTEFPGVIGSFVFGQCKTLPELSGTCTFRFEGSNVPPKKVKLTDLVGYENARRYIGMLITIEDVTIAEEPTADDMTLPTGGRYTAPIDFGSIDTSGSDEALLVSNELYDVLNEGPVIAKGTQFKSVTGVLTYFFDFKLAPRSPEDFELSTVQP